MSLKFHHTVLSFSEAPDILQAKISQLEAHEQELLQKLQENEEDFGLKRAKFRELFLQKEGKLRGTHNP